MLPAPSNWSPVNKTLFSSPQIMLCLYTVSGSRTSGCPVTGLVKEKKIKVNKSNELAFYMNSGPSRKYFGARNLLVESPVEDKEWEKAEGAFRL